MNTKHIQQQKPKKLKKKINFYFKIASSKWFDFIRGCHFPEESYIKNRQELFMLQ